MALFTNETFANQEINVDGNQYEGCTFDTVVLIYGGGDVPRFNNCTFRNVKIDLQGDASNTAEYLNNLYGNGMPNEVEQVMKEVQSGERMADVEVLPPPALNTGDNHLLPLGVAAIIAAFTFWFFAIWVYGWIFQPMAQLADNEPLRTQVDFALIPVLPDDLAVEYDNIRAEQEALLNGGTVNEEGNTTISIESAIQQALNAGFNVNDGDPVVNETTEDDIVVGLDRAPGDGLGVWEDLQEEPDSDG